MKLLIAFIYLALMSFIYVQIGFEISLITGFILLLFSLIHIFRKQNFILLITIVFSVILFGINSKISSTNYLNQFSTLYEIDEVCIQVQRSFEDWQGATGSFKFSGEVFLAETNLEIDVLKGQIENSINLDDLKPKHLNSLIPYSNLKSTDDFELNIIETSDTIPEYIKEILSDIELRNGDYLIEVKYFESVLL